MVAQRKRVDAREKGSVTFRKEHRETMTRRAEQEGNCSLHGTALSSAVNTPDAAAHETEESQQREQPPDTFLFMPLCRW